ncbi:MAG: phosphate signaling complex protein PhoU [Sulfuriferula sp.]|jgi:phosphate transport system protein|nr:phosphate signaling complex protein PhoU [Sulfuriferula sp.]
MPQEHTYKQFDTDLENMRARVLQMGGLVEQQITQAIEALVNADFTLADQVAENDHLVNALEVAIDEDVTQIIARRQPTASDLRMVMTVVKTITDLERIGDEAAKVARMVREIHQNGRVIQPKFNQIEFMSGIVLDMLHQSLDGFARLDASTAADVSRSDIQVDEEYHLILRNLITYMMEDPRTITTFIDIMFIAKAIERMGDHAKNMSEYVVYMVKGKDVRHTTIEVIEREALS